jgi:glycolate oxidase FAD binding subunit
MVTRLRPTSLASLREAVLDGPPRLLISGAGTASGWGGVPSTFDAVLETTGLDGVISYAPSDMTVAVRAGMPLAALQAVLAEKGQRIALDAGRIPYGATVGGLLATGDAGPARHVHGTLRDQVIGITVVLADGTVARSGGQVIKNVAGYDLGKLFHGSLGTLGVVAEVVLRVYPLPAATRTVAVKCDAAAGFDVANRMIADALEPAALEWYDGRLLARFEGTAAGVAQRASGFEEVDPGVWKDVGDLAMGDTVLRAATLPSLSPWVASLTESLSSSVGIGVHTVRLHDPALVVGIREEIEGRGGTTAVLRHGPSVPAWGRPPASVALMRAVKQRFDPADRFGAGRFAPWF